MGIKRVFVFLSFSLIQPLWASRFTQVDLDVLLRNQFSSNFKLAADGDFNGDGYDDVCVNLTPQKYGLILGGSLPAQSDLSLVPHTSILLPASTFFGGSPPFFADMNGDGKDDLFIPVPGSPGAIPNSDIYVIFGTTQPISEINLSASADLVIHTPFWWLFGFRFEKGDFDGDGKGDLLLFGFFTPGDSGYLLLGRTAVGRNAISLDDGVSAVHFRKALGGLGAQAKMGDLNGDGLSDIILSDSVAGMVGRFQAGQVYVFFGTTVPFTPATLDWDLDVKPAHVTITGDSANRKMACPAVGDVTGDGKADLVLAYENPSEVFLWEGHVLAGSGPQVDLEVGIPGHSALWSLNGITTIPVASMTSDVKLADFDGDGKKDVFLRDGTQLIAGLSVTPLESGGLPTAISFVGAGSFDLGDMNGDGKTDLVVMPLGAPDGSVGILYGYRPLDDPSVHVRSRSIPPKVVLDFAVAGDPAMMKLTGDFVEAFNERWIPFQPSLAVTLTQSEGEKNIRVVFRNALKRESPEAQTSLTLNSGFSGLAVVDNVIDSPTKLARVDCHVGSPTHVKAAIYDQAGGFIAEVLNGDLAPGVWPLEWDGKNESGRSVGPGVYYMAIEKEGTYEKRKILVQW